MAAKEVTIIQENKLLYKLSIDGRFLTYSLTYHYNGENKKVYLGGSPVVDYGDNFYFWIIDMNETDKTLSIRTLPLFGPYYDAPMYMFDAYTPQAANITAGRVMLEIEWKEDEWEEEKWIFEGELDWKPVLPKSKEI